MLSGADSLCFHQSADFWLHLGGSSTNIAPAAIVDPERLVRADRGQESAHGIPDDALHEMVVLVQLSNQAAEDVSAPAGRRQMLSRAAPRDVVDLRTTTSKQRLLQLPFLAQLGPRLSALRLVLQLFGRL
eukprot:scaffold1228_cov246-Pinguiococcus_pyrenoidosus.AAC.1